MSCGLLLTLFSTMKWKGNDVIGMSDWGLVFDVNVEKDVRRNDEFMIFGIVCLLLQILDINKRFVV